MLPRTRINHQIQAPELRVIGENGENFGVLSLSEAIGKAREAGADLIEISPTATPPVAKIMDYGRFQYAENKKLKVAKTKVKTVEMKNIQVKVGTGDHDMLLKAKKAAEWLAEGHRVRAELFLKGRYKGMDEKFLKERLEKFLVRIPYAYKLAEPVAKSPKGFAAVIERDAVTQARKEKETKHENK